MITRLLEMLGILFLLGFLGVSPFVAGCSVMSTGPGMMQEITGGVATVGQTLAAKFNPETMTAGVDGSINDPRFQMELIISSGVIVQMELALVGADTSFDVAGAGTGGEMDPELLAQVTAIWNMPGASEDARKLLVTEAVIEWVSKVTIPKTPVDPEP